MAERIVFHVDMDSFFAACEERERPELKGKAVVVCVYSGRGEEGGAVSTASYEARKFGVRSGMPIVMAKRLCTEGVFLPVNFELYSKLSNEIMSILRTHSSVLEQAGLDEAFLDLTSRVEDFAQARNEAETIKADIKGCLGLTCSIGVGPNKLIAKMASGAEKPDGLTVIEPNKVKDFLATLEPDKLWGVGKKTADKLAEIGVQSIGELAAQDEESLKKAFGEARGHWLKLASQGIDEEPVEKRGESEQVGRMATLPKDSRDKGFILNALEPLIEDVHERLTERGDYFRTITINAVTTDLKTHTKSRTLGEPVRDISVMRRLVDDLVSSFLKEKKRVLLRRVGVRVANLTKKGGQRTLMDY